MPVRMRLLYVLNSLAVGGTERQVLALGDRMAARGHAVALMVLRPREADGCSTVLDVIFLDIEKDPADFIAGVRRGMAFVRDFHPDVIHSHNFHGNMLARWMGLACRGPKVISTIHNVYEGGWPRMLAYRLSDPMAHVTTAVSGAVAERYVRLKAVQKSKLRVVTNGIDMAGFVPDAERRAAIRAQMSAGDEFVWIAVGRNTVAKDFPNLLEAFGRVWQISPQARLWIAGETSPGGTEKPTCSAIAMPHGAMDRVRRLGLWHDIPAVLDAADGFVLSSAWEGMPLAVGEAMAMEKPLVATDVGGVRELVGDTGAVVPAKNSNALAEAMLKVMTQSQEERAATGRLARERICGQFNIDARANEWEALYRSVIA
jgi:glycosyltransferase involved in cell wall biosynthesis